MQAPGYRIWLIGRSGPAKGKRIDVGSKRGPGSVKSFGEREVDALIPKLRQSNAKGFDVYLMPVDPAHHYLVIDNMKSGASTLLSDLGFSPCLVQAIDTDDEQAVLKVPKVARDDEQALIDQVARELNQSHGDPNISTTIRPLRMAGFSNRGVDQGGVITHVIEAGHRMCSKAMGMLQTLRQVVDDLVLKRRQQQELDRIQADGRQQAERSRDRDELWLVFDHHDDAQRALLRAFAAIRAWGQLRGLDEDRDLVDRQAAIQLVRAGWSVEEVSAAILAMDDGRHVNPADYALSTAHVAEVEWVAIAAGIDSALDDDDSNSDDATGPDEPGIKGG